MTEAARDLPEVTVVIPAYNIERYIERSILSAIGQTSPNLTVLVVDDGSTDGTLAVCRKLAETHPNLQVVTGPNAGVAAARNRGTELARSEYVAYLDADDLWHPTKIAKQVASRAARDADPAWVACYTLYRVVDEHDGAHVDGGADGPRGRFFSEHLLKNHVDNGSSLLVRRDAALAVGGFDPSYAAQGNGGCEDFDFQLKLLQRFKIELVSEYLVGYRWREEAMSRDNARMARGLIAVVERFAADESLTPSQRRRILVNAQRLAGGRYFRGRDWRGMVRSLTAMFAISPTAAVASLARFGADKADRLIGRTSARGGRYPLPRFLELDPAAAQPPRRAIDRSRVDAVQSATTSRGRP